MTVERVHFKLLRTSCCGTMLCWVNPRLPNYCPECGTRAYPEIKGCVLFSDDNASLKYHGEDIKVPDLTRHDQRHPSPDQ